MISIHGIRYTGIKMELCPECGEVFNNTRAGDKHRVLDYTYALVRWPNGQLDRMREGYAVNEVANLGLAKVSSRHNEARRCLTPEEMRAIGMNQEKNGAWNSGGNWIGAK